MTKSSTSLIPTEAVSSRILMIRGERVLIDADLAELYGVETKVLNQAVRRNVRRFPDDFMFQLTTSEKQEVVTNCDHLQRLKFSSNLPYAFTEQGVAMLSSVLNSERAIEVNILIMRAFVKLREMISTHKELAKKLEDLEQKYDSQFKMVFDAIRQLMTPPEPKKKRAIGFGREEGK